MASVDSDAPRRGDGGDLERSSPLAVTIALVVGFVLLAIVGVVTVVVPEITDDGATDEDAEAVAPAAPVEPAEAPPPPAP